MLIVASGLVAAQTQDNGNRNTGKTVFEERPTTLWLAPHVTTTIRLPEPVNSVIMGDSSLFQAEYSPNEPLLVFARPVISTFAESNLVISTALGRHFILLLRSAGPPAADNKSKVDLFVTCKAAGGFFIEDRFPSAAISETATLGNAAGPETRRDENANVKSESPPDLDEIIARQRRQPAENLFGDRVRVAVGQVIEDASRLIVSFSVINRESDKIELVPPQVQLAGHTKSGIFHRARWATVQQLPVQAYRITQRTLGPGERADGVVVFERPAIKQSTENLMLQIASAAAIDQPTLAPIHFRATKPQEKKS